MRRGVVRAVAVGAVLTTGLLAAAVAPAAADNPPVFLAKWGTLGTGTTQFDTPSALAIGPDGAIYTIDSVNSRVQKFTANGTFVRQWGRVGTGRAQFTNPEGIAVASDGTVFVSDDGDRIQTFTSDGAFIRRFGQTGSALGRLSDPAGLAVDENDSLYVADRGNNRVQKYRANGQFLNAFGVAGGANGQFNAPSAVAVDSEDHVLVADTGNHRVQVFSLFGSFVTAFGSQGAGNGQFQSPRGLSVDSTNHVFVADSGNDRVQELTNSGAFVSTWGSTGSGKGRFHNPTATAVDRQDDVYVTDAGNHRVQEFGPVPQPDGSIRLGTTGDFAGDGIYNTSGRAQTASATASRGAAVTFDVSIGNDGPFPDDLRLRGGASTRSYAVRYAIGGTNITAAVTAGTFTTDSLVPGEAVTVRITVSVGSGAPAGSSLSATLKATSVLDPTRLDVVRFVTARS